MRSVVGSSLGNSTSAIFELRSAPSPECWLKIDRYCISLLQVHDLEQSQRFVDCSTTREMLKTYVYLHVDR